MNTTQAVFSFPCNKVVYIQCHVHNLYVNTLYKCFIAMLLFCDFFFYIFKERNGGFLGVGKKKLICSNCYYMFCMFFQGFFFQLIECSIFAFTIFWVFGLSRLTSEGIHDLYMWSLLECMLKKFWPCFSVHLCL